MEIAVWGDKCIDGQTISDNLQACSCRNRNRQSQAPAETYTCIVYILKESESTKFAKNPPEIFIKSLNKLDIYSATSGMDALWDIRL